MTHRLLSAALASALIVTGPAAAADAARAQLAGVEGKVMVARGGALVPASPGALAPSERVIAMDGGKARLSWADGCEVTIDSGAMVTVDRQSPCAGAAGLITAGPSSAQTSPGPTTLQWVGIGLTVITLGIGIAAASDDLSVSN